MGAPYVALVQRWFISTQPFGSSIGVRGDSAWRFLSKWFSVTTNSKLTECWYPSRKLIDLSASGSLGTLLTGLRGRAFNDYSTRQIVVGGTLCCNYLQALTTDDWFETSLRFNQVTKNSKNVFETWVTIIMKFSHEKFAFKRILLENFLKFFAFSSAVFSVKSIKVRFSSLLSEINNF